MWALFQLSVHVLNIDSFFFFNARLQGLALLSTKMSGIIGQSRCCLHWGVCTISYFKLDMGVFFICWQKHEYVQMEGQKWKICLYTPHPHPNPTTCSLPHRPLSSPSLVCRRRARSRMMGHRFGSCPGLTSGQLLLPSSSPDCTALVVSSFQGLSQGLQMCFP